LALKRTLNAEDLIFDFRALFTANVSPRLIG
jgi:hypothetical protein